MKNLCMVFSMSILLAFSSGCGEKKELTLFPLENGDEFVYEELDYTQKIGGIEVSHIPFQHVYRVKSQENGGFLVEFIIRATDRSGKVLDNNISQKQGASLFDKYGRLTGRTKGQISSRLEHNFANLWLPPSRRQNGAKTRFHVNTSDWNVEGPVKWEEWDAWKVTCEAEYSKTALYFDDKTGFMVGNSNYRLVQTNKKELKTAKSRVPGVK